MRHQSQIGSTTMSSNPSLATEHGKDDFPTALDGQRCRFWDLFSNQARCIGRKVRLGIRAKENDFSPITTNYLMVVLTSTARMITHSHGRLMLRRPSCQTYKFVSYSFPILC